jgi:hypothetical protein
VSVSDFDLERFVIDDVTADERRRIAGLLATDPELARRIAALRCDNAATLALHPPRRVEAEVLRRTSSSSSSSSSSSLFWSPARWRVVATTTGLAACAAVVLLAPRSVEHASGPTSERVKGEGQHLFATHVDGDRQQPITTGSTLPAGAVVQLGVAGLDGHFGVVVSLDGRGAVTLHAPEHGEHSIAWPATTEPGDVASLSSSFTLDDAPSFERFVLVSAPSPFPVAAVVDALHVVAAHADRGRDEPLTLPFSAFQQSLVVLKDTP